ncbi:MAG: sulfite exporter TauE/SafE family protein, partial [Rhodospirillales bacterium]|nr:sulfite exporter TauE/SafE family protein [Rhodospirillales bacterium]
MGVVEYSPANLAIIVSAVFLGGMVKGVFGLGLPFVATSILAMFLGVPNAISLMLVPVIFSNLWQAWQGGIVRQFKRFWGLIVLLLPGTWVGTEFLIVADQRTLILLMGSSLGGFAL